LRSLTSEDVLSSSPLQTAGLASGILNSSREAGGVLGVALFGALVEAAQIRGMYWAPAFAAAILVPTLIIVRKIHSVNAFNVKLPSLAVPSFF